MGPDPVPKLQSDWLHDLMHGEQADNIRRSILKHSFLLMKSGIQGFAEVLDLTKDRSTMTDEERDLDNVQNKAFFPVFQTTLKTPETAAVVLELENDEEQSRETYLMKQQLLRK